MDPKEQQDNIVDLNAQMVKELVFWEFLEIILPCMMTLAMQQCWRRKNGQHNVCNLPLLVICTLAKSAYLVNCNMETPVSKQDFGSITVLEKKKISLCNPNFQIAFLKP